MDILRRLFPIILIFFISCKKNNIHAGKAYVLIVAGQSQAVGRAPNIEMSANIAQYKFSRTKIWSRIADATTMTWSAYLYPNYPKSDGWEVFNPVYNQSFNQDPDFHGIEVAFAYLFETSHPQDTLYIIKHANGGIPLSVYSGIDWNINSSNEMYSAFVNQYLKPAFSSKELTKGYVPFGFWWAQGETDATQFDWASSYNSNLVSFFDKISNNVPEVEKFNKYLGRIAYPIITQAAYKEIVRMAQKKYCDDYKATLIDCDDVPVIPNNGHFSAKGYELLAGRLFVLMNK